MRFHYPIVLGFVRISTSVAGADNREILFYDDRESIASAVPTFLQSICVAGFNGHDYSANAHCKNGSCEAHILLGESHPTGAVFLTSDFHLLFSRSDVSPGVRTSTRTTHVLPKSGVSFDLVQDRLPLVNDKAQLEALDKCFSETGKILREKFENKLSTDRIPAATTDIAAMNQITQRLATLESGELSIVLPKRVDVREDAIITVEFTPTLKFAFSDPTDDPKFMEHAERSIDDLLSKAKRMGPTASATAQISNYVGRTLVPIASSFKSIEIAIQSDDASLTELAPSKQVLHPLVTSRWLWKVRLYDKRDIATLRLKIANPQLPGSEPLFFQALDIQVAKTWDYRIQKFFSTYWQWIVGTFVLPLILYFWRGTRS